MVHPVKGRACWEIDHPTLADICMTLRKTTNTAAVVKTKELGQWSVKVHPTLQKYIKSKLQHHVLFAVNTTFALKTHS